MKADALTRDRRFDRASQEYAQIEDRLLCCAGVRYHHGLALLRANQLDQAAQVLSDALEDCANYRPAFEALSRCYAQLNRSAELDSLRRLWNCDPIGSSDASAIDDSRVSSSQPPIVPAPAAPPTVAPPVRT